MGFGSGLGFEELGTLKFLMVGMVGMVVVVVMVLKIRKVRGNGWCFPFYLFSSFSCSD